MDRFQMIVGALLLGVDSSRAMLHLASDDGAMRIVAEAVRHDQHQIRHGHQAADAPDAAKLAALARDGQILVENDGGQGAVRAQMLAPLMRDGRLVGLLAVQHAPGPKTWSAADRDRLSAAQAEVLAELARTAGLARSETEDLRAAAAQAILDHLRIALDVQRCTFRQPVEAAYAFPVTFESRAEGVNALFGDFTIVQSGQPVINKLLAERAQVVQDDCSVASTEPLFHVMLKHYGGMRAQIVTPFIVGDDLRGVLSIHELRHTRVWTAAEKALGAQAALLLGGLFETGR